MARSSKKAEPVQMDLVDELSVKKMTAARYWEWRNTITDLWLAEQKLKNAELELKLKQKDVDLAMARAQVFGQTVVRQCRTDTEEAKAEYFKLKSELEKEVGISLDGKVINDVTFEIRELDDDPEPKTAEV